MLRIVIQNVLGVTYRGTPPVDPRANKLYSEAHYIITKSNTMTTKQVKTKEDFKEKMSTLEQEFITRKKHPKYRVSPNLTPRGRDILMRLNNKSLSLQGERSYTQNEEIVNARLMSKHELKAAATDNARKIDGLKKGLEEQFKKAEELKMSFEAEQISKSKKDKEDEPKPNG